MKVVLDENGNPIFPPGTPESVQAEVRRALKELENGNFEEVDLDRLD